MTKFRLMTLPKLAALMVLSAPAMAAPRDVYVVPFSHLDFFWGGTREECLARGNRILAKAIAIARQNPSFRFLMEDEDFVANYVESHAGTPELADLKRLVRDGRIEISPKWAGIFQDLPDGEILTRNFIYGKRYAQDVFGVDPKTAHIGDLPGYTPQYPQILQQTRTPYMVMTRMGPPEHPLFYWKAPDGSRELVWFSLKGYGWGAQLGLADDITPEREAKIKQDIAEIGPLTSAPIFMNWGSDLYTPTERLVPNLATLNQNIPALKMAFSTPDEYFERVAGTPNLPVLSGEIPSAWPNIVSSLPHMWPLVVPATATLEAAERFAAVNYALGYADYPEATLDFLWKKLIESTDHNHDGQGGIIGDTRKADYSRLSIIRGGEILRDSLRNIAERVRIPVSPSVPVVVFNPEGWQRDDVVRSHLTIFGDVVPGRINEYRKGLRLVDETGANIPFHVDQSSDNISRALDISFVARRVPALGYKTYYLKPAADFEKSPEAAKIVLDSVNDTKDPRRPYGSDVMENDFYRVSVDKATGRVTLFDKQLNRDVVKAMEVSALEEQGGNYVGVEPLSGRTIYTTVDRVDVEENNGVRATLKIVGHLADIPVTQRLSLWQGLKRLDIENTVDWRKVRYLRIEQVVPYQIHDARIQYGVPFGSNAAENLIPNSGPHFWDEISKDSWLNARHIQDWISAGAPDWELTMATDHQFVRLDGGVFRGEMLRGTKATSVKIVSDNGVDSMHYPPPGTYTFKYSITSGSGDWRTRKSYRTGLNFNNPLLPVSVVDDVTHKTLPPSQSFLEASSENIVLSAVKKAGRGSDIIVRWYENEGVAANPNVLFLGKPVNAEPVNLLEEPAAKGVATGLRPFEIKTLRLPVRR